MKWMVPINSLDAVQMRVIDQIVENPEKNHWVKGFAGSGKTIVLTHVLQRLASERPTPKICFATFTHALKDMVETGLPQSAISKIEFCTLHKIGGLRGRFDVVVADELQDIPTRLLEKFREKGTSVVFAADFDQSIHIGSTTEALLKATIKPVKEHQLKEIHRINENVFHVATCVYRSASVLDDHLVRVDDKNTFLYKAKSQSEEFSTMFKEAVRVASKEYPSAIAFPNRALIDQFILCISKEKKFRGTPPSVKAKSERSSDEYVNPFDPVNEYLISNSSELRCFGSGAGDLLEADKRKVVYLMTYSSVKGLDFANVFLPNLTSTTKLDPMVSAKDINERRMFFVATTRARERLYMSYTGEPHRFIREIQEIDDELLVKFTGKATSW